MQVLVLAAQNVGPVRAARRRHLRVDALPAGRRLDRRLGLRRDLRQPARRATSPTRCRRERSFRTRSARASSRSCRRRFTRSTSTRSSRRSGRSSASPRRSRWSASRSPGCCGRCRCARARRPRASPRASRPHATRSRCRSWSGSWPRSRSARTAGASTSRWPTTPASISIRPSCGCSRGSERTRRSTSTIPLLVAAGVSLRERGLIEDDRLGSDGQDVYGRVLAVRRQRLAELLDGWSPEEHDEVRAMLDDFAREYVAEPPAASRT